MAAGEAKTARTAAARIAGRIRRALGRLARLVRRRTHRLRAEPAQDLVPDGAGRLRIAGDNPRFALRSDRLRPPVGWVSLALPGGGEPWRLLVDVGFGFEDATAVHLRAGHGKDARHRLPLHVHALALEPLGEDESIAAPALTAVEIGDAWVLLSDAALLARSIAGDVAREPRLFLRRLARAWRGGWGALRRAGASRVWRALERADYDRWIERCDTLTRRDRSLIRARIERLARRPRISVLVPVCDPPPGMLEAAIASVRAQLYPDWELCLADDASTRAEVGALLDSLRDDARIRIARRGRRGGIAAATNDALALAAGEYVAFLDHDDVLSEHALYHVAEALGRTPDAEILYSDDDKIDADGRRFAPYFKPDWNLELFFGQNYVSHLLVMRTELVRRLGGLRSECDGSQDYDLVLRAVREVAPARIVHIPHVLYHWRVHAGSAAAGDAVKPAPVAAARRALGEALSSLSPGARVAVAAGGRFRITHALPATPPLVSVVMATRDRPSLLRVALEGVLERTRYPSLELVLVDNGSVEAETLALIDALRADARVRVLRDDGPFNFAALNNRAAALARGELLAFLNNDIEVTDPDWLGELVREVLRPGVGAAGAKLLYPNGTVQHAGVVLGLGGAAGHLHRHLSDADPGYFGRAHLTQAFSAATAAALVVRRAAFEAAGGFDAEYLAVAFNDVDLCLRLGARGLRIVWTPWARLVHHESASRPRDDDPAQEARFRRELRHLERTWQPALAGDPQFNPNLSLDHELCRPALPPRLAKPWEPGAARGPRPWRRFALAICAIAKNEARDILEWIAFHRVVGVEHFFVYDNGSTDGTREILEALDARNLVTLERWDEPFSQLAAYAHHVGRHRGAHRWTAFIDLDEFIVPAEGASAPRALERFERHPGVGVSWLHFGSAGHRERPPGLLIEQFVRRAPDAFLPNAHPKPIVRTAGLRALRHHHCLFEHGVLVNQAGRALVDAQSGEPLFADDPSFIAHEPLRIHHYYVKSAEDWQRKVERGRAHAMYPLSPRKFALFDRNEVEDRTALRFLEETRAELAALQRLL